jgi:hypothetical protein
MGRHAVKIRLLALMTAVSLLISLSAGAANAASYPGAVQRAGRAIAASSSGAAAARRGLASCTKPLFGSDKDCESTSPLVDRWVTFGSGSSSCTYTMHVDWGDGTSSQRTFRDPSSGVTLLIGSHTYRSETHTTTYSETVTSTVDAGTCLPIDTTIFHITHLKSAVAPWKPMTELNTKCNREAALEVASLGLGLAEVAGLFTISNRYVGLLIFVGSAAIVLKFIYGCVVHGSSSSTALTPESSAASSAVYLPPLPRAFAYGAKHPGKRFKPSGKVLPRPQITGIYGYQKGSLVYFSLTYSNPDRDAKGFGFVGIKGAGWALENHPFSSPSYGIVGKDRIDYPFNLACGTAQQHNSWVEAWIYNSQGLRSNPVEVALTCTT